MAKVIQKPDRKRNANPRKGMRRMLQLIGGLIGLLIVLILTLFIVGRGRLNRAPAAAGSPVTVPTDAEAIVRGEKLANISGCTACHGSNLAGTPFIDAAPIGFVPAPNLTSGAGGVMDAYSADSYELAIRHGVAADGRTMVSMPSDHYAHYGDDDLGDLIAYLQQVDPQDNELGTRQMMFPGNIIFGIFAYSSWPVNLVDHAAVGGDAPVADSSAEYGEYLVSIASCQSCHAENLAGNYGQLDTPRGPNLTIWPEQHGFEAFVAAVRSGQGSDGEVLDEEMPWSSYARFTDSEMEALWAYLNTVEVLEDNAP